jgi:hypothetical protein
MNNFKNNVGYVTDTDGIHVCGFIGAVVLFQDNRNGIGKQRGAKLHTNDKGAYFNLDGKRVYLKYSLKK